ncbi:MAG: class I SAM-dependent methyltransferase [Deltaproteobacteria bacterium]|nr:class I SAM-dependent methyltransferase [Candidatus Zymogenaceae bacterium]
MKEGLPSATADSVAQWRAAHQLLDNPLVFEDPLALRIIGKEAASQLTADPQRFEATWVSSYLRAFLAARSRIAEDELAKRVLHGVRQYVILGAGLDTFAYRSPYPEGTLTIFEVDHPTTQAYKRERLKEADIAISLDVRFVPIDFETRTLSDGLIAAGFAFDAPTFFSWLGVTLYLPVEVVMWTLRFVASFPHESGIAFDYTISPSLMTGAGRAAFHALAARVAETGEVWRTFFDPARLAEDVREMGFGCVRDWTPGEINAHYFSNRDDGLIVGGLSHVMCARV